MSDLNDKARTILQNPHLLERMRPLLLKCLHMKIQNRTPIKVLKPISNLTIQMSKSLQPTPVMSGEVIPSGIELVYDGYELGQMFFKSFRNGQEGATYSVYQGENLVVGNQQTTRNLGLMGLMLNTDVFTNLLDLMGQRETE